MNSTAKRTWVEIDLDALDNNFRNIRACVPDGCKIMSVIKAGAYGHGATRIAAELEPQTDWFAVSNTDEAMQLRRAGIRKPVLILGYSDPEQIPFLADNDITQTVYSEEYAGKLNLSDKSSLDNILVIFCGLNNSLVLYLPHLTVRNFSLSEAVIFPSGHPPQVDSSKALPLPMQGSH